MNSPAYTYRAFIDRVVDGDTVIATIDLGFNTSQKVRLRLMGVDTPEVVGTERAAGLAAKEWLNNVLAAQRVIVETHKDRGDKYGRYLAVIWLDGKSVNAELIAKGFGVEQRL